MTYTPERLEQKIDKELSGSGYVVVLARVLVQQMCDLSKSQRAEIARLTAENERLRAWIDDTKPCCGEQE